MSKIRETDLYPPVKAFLQDLGYEVKAEIGPADVMGIRPGDDTVLVELKTGFSLTLLQQAVARQAVTENVYVAVPRWSGRAGWRAFKGNLGLCRRLGLGVMTVRLPGGPVEIHADPGPYRPRKSARRLVALSTEFKARRGDPNTGGVRGGRVTAYRQSAEACARLLMDNGPTKGAAVAASTGVQRATRIMADNHYGWFFRVETGIYDLTEAGRRAVQNFAISPVDSETGTP